MPKDVALQESMGLIRHDNSYCIHVSEEFMRALVGTRRDLSLQEMPFIYGARRDGHPRQRTDENLFFRAVMTHAEHLTAARDAQNAGDFSEAERVAHLLLAESDPHEEPHITALIVLADSARLQGAYTKAQTYAEAALALAEEHKHSTVMPKVWHILGIVHYSLGSYDKALEYFSKAFAHYEALGEKSGAVRITGNIGSVYYSLGKYDKALEYFGKELAQYEELGEKSGVARVMGNIGNVYVYSDTGEFGMALEYYSKALAAHQELGEKSGAALVTGNIGNVYSDLGKYDTALEYYSKALAAHQELGEQSGVALVTGNIGSLYAIKDYDGYDPTKAEDFLLKAVEVSEKIGHKHYLYIACQSIADLYEHQKRWEETHFYFKKFYDIEKQVQSEEAAKQAAHVEQQRQAAEREKEIAIKRTQAAAIEKVLHQVLPASIAARLIKGEKVADYFDQISILFADIVGFTQIASQMPTRAVLAFLNHVFGEFDRIIESHGCEKIKTIGDGYMAVSGAPVECADHAERLARAALAIMEEIHLPDEIRVMLPANSVFHVRIGLHSGSAFGGIVGEKRFVYDVYSDAVNTASRMESHGLPGKIHVSEEFMRALVGTGRDLCLQDGDLSLQDGDLPVPNIDFIERGEMDIKGKGIMRTYFLEQHR